MAVFRNMALAVIGLVLLAGAVNAQKCTVTSQNQTANLANVAPKGCLKELITAATGGEESLKEMIKPECFNKLHLVRTDNKGTGCDPSTFTVAFDDKKCAPEGFDTIADGTLKEAAKAGEFKATGNFSTGTPFSGTLNAKNQLTVSAQGSKCELTYSLKDAGKAVAGNATKAAETAKAAAGDAKDAAATKAADAKDAAKPKSSAGMSGASALLALLCVVLAVLL